MSIKKKKKCESAAMNSDISAASRPITSGMVSIKKKHLLSKSHNFSLSWWKFGAAALREVSVVFSVSLLWAFYKWRRTEEFF